MPKPRAPSRLLKKLPRGCGPARARQADRSGHDRGVVCRRGPDRAEEQDHPALGQARLATLGAARSTHRLNLGGRRILAQCEHIKNTATYPALTGEGGSFFVELVALHRDY